jgi:hypothetical protein
MHDEILRKLKKGLTISILVVAGISVLLAVAIISFAFRGGSARENTNSLAVQGFAPSYLGSGSTFIGEDSMKGTEAVSSPVAPENIQTTGTNGQTEVSPIVERKLMQDGSLSLVVKQVEAAVESLTGIAENLGGRVDDIQYSDDAKGNAKKRAEITIRVPAVNFDMAIVQAKGVALKVESENVSTRDVTEQFIDMQARLKNLKAEEEQYLAVMQTATKVPDILEVSQYLFNVRQQIEQLQGQMNYLSRQIDMSVITIQLSSEPDVDATNVVWNPMTTVKEAVQFFIQTFYFMVDAIIWSVLTYLPLAILIGVLLLGLTWIFKKALRPAYEVVRDFLNS